MAVKFMQAHYFLWFCGLTGILQYVSMFAKKHTKQGATSIGSLMAILPFVALLAKPTFCGIADHFSAHKLVLIIALISAFFGYGLLTIIPFIDNSINWYLFCIFVLIANSAMGVITSLSDSVAMKQVATKSVSYGSMRLFGTLGWGTGALLSGVINDEHTQKYFAIKLPLYVPGLILVFGLLIIVDIVLVVIKFNQNKSAATDGNVEINLKAIENLSEERVNKEEDKTSISVMREIMNAFSKYPSLYQYTFIATVVGILTGFHWTFFYWLLADLVGDSDTILPGLCGAVQTFCGELPCFLFAEIIVNKIGCAMTLNISLLAFAVRYFCYAYLIPIVPPYFVLLVELTQGPAFGLFYSVITKIAQEYATKAASNSECDNQSKRTFATMQGIMGGCFEGAGVGIGGLLGGLLIDNWKLSGVWLTGAILAVITVILNVFIEMIKLRRNSRVNLNDK